MDGVSGCEALRYPSLGQVEPQLCHGPGDDGTTTMFRWTVLVIEGVIEPQGDRLRKWTAIEPDQRFLQALPGFGGGVAGDLLLSLNQANGVDESLGCRVICGHEMQVA